MSLWFNEIDNYCIERLKVLWPEAGVNAKDIRKISKPPTAERCHFFGGIGGWELALNLAGWSGPVWTGSCPCPPFSTAGRKTCKTCGTRFSFWGKDNFGCKRCKTNDERHLWPEFRRLIALGRPSVIFGEQVASRDGREWLARVRADLEALGYAVGATDLCAAGVRTPQLRQRLFWVADAISSGVRRQRPGADAEASSGVQGADGQRQRLRLDAGPCGEPGRRDGDKPGRLAADSDGSVAAAGAWDDYRIVYCRDPKGGPDIARRASAELAAFPLAHGVPGRVARLRAIGNAIVPQLAAVFIKAWMGDMKQRNPHKLKNYGRVDFPRICPACGRPTGAPHLQGCVEDTLPCNSIHLNVNRLEWLLLQQRPEIKEQLQAKLELELDRIKRKKPKTLAKIKEEEGTRIRGYVNEWLNPKNNKHPVPRGNNRPTDRPKSVHPGQKIPRNRWRDLHDEFTRGRRS